jgi:hypothetical protein
MTSTRKSRKTQANSATINSTVTQTFEEAPMNNSVIDMIDPLTGEVNAMTVPAEEAGNSAETQNAVEKLYTAGGFNFNVWLSKFDGKARVLVINPGGVGKPITIKDNGSVTKALYAFADMANGKWLVVRHGLHRRTGIDQDGLFQNAWGTVSDGYDGGDLRIRKVATDGWHTITQISGHFYAAPMRAPQGVALKHDIMDALTDARESDRPVYIHVYMLRDGRLDVVLQNLMLSADGKQAEARVNSQKHVATADLRRRMYAGAVIASKDVVQVQMETERVAGDAHVENGINGRFELSPNKSGFLPYTLLLDLGTSFGKVQYAQLLRRGQVRLVEEVARR